MRYRTWILGMVFISGFSAFSQENYKENTVGKGETITKIAQQYNIKASEIYNLNPDAKKGIKFKSVLLIPNAGQKTKSLVADKTVTTTTKTYTAYPKETLYSIAKKHGITVDELYRINPTLQKSGLKNGQKIQVPVVESNLVTADKATKSNVTTNESAKQANDISSSNQKPSATIIEISSGQIIREILPNETKYAIAREYGLTVAELDHANPVLETEALKIGQKIIIPVKDETTSKNIVLVEEAKKREVSVATVAKKEIEIQEVQKKPLAEVKAPIVADEVAETVINREVLAKETKYGIAKEFGISVKELEKQNPKIARSLPVGFVLTIRSKKQLAPVVEQIAMNDESSDKYNAPYNGKTAYNSEFLDKLVSIASENLGTRYVYGGTSKNGIDCSGLMCNTFSAFDIQLPRTSLEQSQYGVVINNEDAQKGDLIFFKTSRKNRINHVGMVVDVNDGDIKFIHASVSGGVIISSIKEKYYSKKLSQINRVL
jgi:cell wall-associated NlpC family hydrolase